MGIAFDGGSKKLQVMYKVVEIKPLQDESGKE